jgi:integrase
MPRLSVVAVRNARHDPAKGQRAIRIGDGDGLYLQVKPGGTKSWLFRYTRRGTAREMGLGAVATTPAEERAGGVTLAAARDLARDAKALLRAGKDPLAERAVRNAQAAAAQAQARTFEAAARALVESKRPGWRNAKHAAQWLTTLEQHAFPKIGGIPVADVDTAAVRRVLDPIWTRIPETAARVRQRIEAVLDFARAQGWRPEALANPARWRGHLSAALPPPRKVKAVRHHPALPWQQMPDFMTALAQHEGMPALALRFAILTASRTGPVRLARWREMDLAGAVWAVPGAHMKGGEAHRAPLSPAALAMLEEVRPLGGEPGDLVFPGARKGRALSDLTLSRLVRGMACDGLPDGAARPRWADHEGRPVVPHGFRASFKGWSLAAGWPDPLSELALAHADKDRVRAAYAREDQLQQRRPMMDAWAAHCGGGSGASDPANRQATEAGAASPLPPSEAMPPIRFVL